MLQLTERQRDVLACAAAGMGVKETARFLNLSTETIKDHRKYAMANLFARSITEAVAVAVQRRMLGDWREYRKLRIVEAA